MKKRIKRIINCAMTECNLFNRSIREGGYRAATYHESRLGGVLSALTCLGYRAEVKYEECLGQQEIVNLSVYHNNELKLDITDFCSAAVELEEVII